MPCTLCFTDDANVNLEKSYKLIISVRKNINIGGI